MADTIDSAVTTATINAASVMKGDTAEGVVADQPVLAGDASSSTSRSSSLSTSLSTATSFTHGSGIPRRRAPDNIAEVQEAHVVSALLARKSIAVLSSLPSAPPVPYAMPSIRPPMPDIEAYRGRDIVA